MDIRDYNSKHVHTAEMIWDMAVGYLGRFIPASTSSGQRTTNQESSLACETYFDIARKSLLELHAWSFAIKEDRLEEFIPDEYDKARLSGGYIIPADNIRILAVGLRGCGDCGTFSNEGHTIRENLIFPCCGADVRYIYDNTKYEQWSPKAINALALLLARDISSSVVMDATMTLYEVIDKLFDKAVLEAITLDSYTRDIRVKGAKTKKGSFLWR